MPCLGVPILSATESRKTTLVVLVDSHDTFLSIPPPTFLVSFVLFLSLSAVVLALPPKNRDLRSAGEQGGPRRAFARQTVAGCDPSPDIYPGNELPRGKTKDLARAEDTTVVTRSRIALGLARTSCFLSLSPTATDDPRYGKLPEMSIGDSVALRSTVRETVYGSLVRSCVFCFVR